mgnify:CR=1 FL=1
MEKFEDVPNPWVELQDEKGRPYFHHIIEGRTVRQKPKEFEKYVAGILEAFIGKYNWQSFHDDAKVKEMDLLQPLPFT